MSDEKACVCCGFGDELEELLPCEGDDGTQWWIHSLCQEVRAV